MTYDDAIRHYGRPAELARKLGVSRQVVYNWSQRGIPVPYQTIIQYKTRGKLRADAPQRP